MGSQVMPGLKITLSPAQLAALHAAAVRAGRSDSEFVRQAVNAALFKTPAEADVQTFDDEKSGRAVVAATLSRPLRNAIAEIAAIEGRSNAHVLRMLLREGLLGRGVRIQNQNDAVSPAP